MELERRQRAMTAVLAGLALAGAAVLLAHGPVAQPQDYHCFADERRWLGVPNFWNVATNLPFVLSGLLGLCWAARAAGARWRRHAVVFFGGVLLTGFGSAYYHRAPADATLFWDRLPLTFAFMSLFALAIGDRLSERGGHRGLVPLVAAGAAAMLWWRWTGDVRWYALVQFFPMLVIPLLVLFMPGRYFGSRAWWGVAGLYGAAKLAELLDREILLATGFSGHSVKHLLAAAAPVAVWWMLRNAPEPLSTPGSASRALPGPAGSGPAPGNSSPVPG